LNQATANSASLTVLVNAPPVPGVFTVVPTEGNAYSTQYTFSATKWSDENLPISYEFGYISSSGTYLVLLSKSESTYGSSMLSAGLDINSYIISSRAQIFDSLDGSSIRNFDVTVRQRAAMNATELQSFVQAQLSGGTTNVNSIKQSTTLVSSLLNQVNCSYAPNCSSLNRKECSTTANTCGSCVVGDYIGEIGDIGEIGI
jgi:hypothetical protein